MENITQEQRTFTLPDEVYNALTQGKHVSIELKGQQLIFHQKEDVPIDSHSYAERTKGKTFDELLHEGKREAQRVLEDQGIASMALYISEIMVQSIDGERKRSAIKNHVVY